MATSKPELACVYAALILADDDIDVTVSITSWARGRVHFAAGRLWWPLLSAAGDRFSVFSFSHRLPSVFCCYVRVRRFFSDVCRLAFGISAPAAIPFYLRRPL